MHIRKFQKTKENFTCLSCEVDVLGDGFTNHCPECLTSRHVDIFPGDRKEECRGEMQVTDVAKKGDGYQLVHTCTSCKEISRDHFRDSDNFEALIQVIEKISKRNEKK